MEYLNECPHCGDQIDGYECDNCGFADDSKDEESALHQFETQSGNIVYCSEKDAYDAGYISICPICLYSVITWWELEDHGKCIECWHKSRDNSLT